MKRRQAKIKRMIEEVGTLMAIPKNKIDRILSLNVEKNTKKKIAEIYVNLPPKFDLETIQPERKNKILYNSSKKSFILKPNRENNMNIYSVDYIFNEEIKRGIHHPITKKTKNKIQEILYKFLIQKTHFLCKENIIRFGMGK